MKYIYGPVNSRRLGLSLGLSLTPYKICNFDCVYCQLGETKTHAKERKEYINIEDILEELKTWLNNNSELSAKLNFITFSGSGEPTLNNKIGILINQIKHITNIPVAVITNSSNLINSQVRQEILGADLIVPSLDAVTPNIFAKIDRPALGINVEDVTNGLIALRKEFKGKIWLEIMLVKGINDDLRHIKKLKEAVERINPDRIQLNSPVRTTTEDGILPVEKPKLKKIQRIFGDRCEIF